MKRLSDLRVLFIVVAAVESIYALAALLTPPSAVQAVTGWVLTADGQWLVKLIGVALASQAWVAWTFRNRPEVAIGAALALYQLGSASVDWIMWMVLADQQIFSTTLGRVTVVASIAVHYALGVLLVLAIRARRRAERVIPSHL